MRRFPGGRRGGARAERNDFWRFEHAGWERAAPTYESSWTDVTSLFIPPLLDAVGVAPGVRLLDVACGPGYVSEAASRRGASTVGVDFSGRMIARARQRSPGLDFREGDAQELPFEAGSFDAVAVNFGVPHLADPARAFAEARRVLRPGGRLGFTVWAKPEANVVAGIVADAIEAHADLEVDLPEGPPSFFFSDAGECRRTLASAGFDVSSMTFATVQSEWRVPTPVFLFEAERDGGVRTAGLLARQTPERLAAIRSSIEKAVERFVRQTGYAIPVAAHVVTATAAPPAGHGRKR